MTSAPMSASICAAQGPRTTLVSSSILSPLSGPDILFDIPTISRDRGRDRGNADTQNQ